MPAYAAAHAKLNLRLVVLARESSGYHQIETTFCRLDLHDDVFIAPRPGGVDLDVDTLPEHGAPADALGPPDANLAVRAARAFFAAAGLDAGAAIRLVKRIPAGAGLGGGSSDAAAVLDTLNALHGRPLGRDALLQLGAALGSDVPFFLSGASLALAWGRGGRLAPLPPLPPRAVLLAVPAVRVATADAYAALADARAPGFAAPPAALSLPLASWDDAAALACNDFEPVLFRRLPALAALRDALQRCGARIARMTGTGSVIFGIFDDEPTAAAATALLGREFPDVRFIRTNTV